MGGKSRKTSAFKARFFFYKKEEKNFSINGKKGELKCQPSLCVHEMEGT